MPRSTGMTPRTYRSCDVRRHRHSPFTQVAVVATRRLEDHQQDEARTIDAAAQSSSPVIPGPMT